MKVSIEIEVDDHLRAALAYAYRRETASDEQAARWVDEVVREALSNIEADYEEELAFLDEEIDT